MKRQKLLKVAGGALAAAMSLAMLAGCSGNTTSGSSSTGETGTASESSTAGETTGTEKNKLAFFLPMTGDQMQYGESLSRGAELALKQYNEKNGTDYVIEIMDDKGDPKEAVNVANLIVSDPTVIAGMGSFSSSCAMAAAPVFEEADLLLFSPNASHTDFPAMGENMFSAVMSQKYEGAEFADALIEMFGAQNVAITASSPPTSLPSSTKPAAARSSCPRRSFPARPRTSPRFCPGSRSRTRICSTSTLPTMTALRSSCRPRP